MVLRGNGGRISRRQRSMKGRTTYLFGSLKCNLNQLHQTAPKGCYHEVGGLQSYIEFVCILAPKTGLKVCPH